MTDILSLDQKSGGASTALTNVLRNRNFLMLWIGEGISLLGDQFYMIALPWLVLSLTGNALAVGTVFATAGIPRALFMLVGGALIGLNATVLLVCAGILMTLFTLSAAFSPAVRAGME